MSETALALVQSITAVEFFKPGASKPLLEKVKKEARELAAAFDVSTPAGQDGLRTLAAQIGKTKNKIENEGKALVAGEKARLKVIDTERGVVWDEMEALQKEVRQPLTDKENAEKDRIAAHESALQELVTAGQIAEQKWDKISLDDMRASLAKITASQYDWQEFLAPARQVRVKTIGQIKYAIARREKMDVDAAELERLRAESAAQAQRDREARIAQDAREAAEALARERAAEQARVAEAERQRVELERAEAEAKAKQAEAQRVAAEAKAVQDAADAAEALRVEQERAMEAATQAAAAAEEALRAAHEQARLAAEQAERTRIATEEAARLAEQRRFEAEEETRAAIARESYARLHAVASARYNDAHTRITREEAAVTALDAKLLSAGVLKERKKIAGQLKKAQELDANILRLTSDVATKKSAVAKIEKLGAKPECPTCSQSITAEVMGNLYEPLKSAYDEAAKSLRDAQDARKALGDPEGAAREVETHEQAARDMESAKQRVKDDQQIQRDAEKQLETLTKPPTSDDEAFYRFDND